MKRLIFLVIAALVTQGCLPVVIVPRAEIEALGWAIICPIAIAVFLMFAVIVIGSVSDFLAWVVKKLTPGPVKSSPRVDRKCKPPDGQNCKITEAVGNLVGWWFKCIFIMGGLLVGGVLAVHAWPILVVIVLLYLLKKLGVLRKIRIVVFKFLNIKLDSDN